MVKINKQRVGFAALLILVYMVSFGVGTVIGTHMDVTPQGPAATWFGSPQVNILFMGIDARPPQVNARSDTMILASIDKRSNKAVLVWIPRDTRIETSAGHYDKINSVNSLKGPEAACQAVSKLLNVPVDYYVLTNFQGFSKIVDILGGVHIDVETNMRHSDPDPTLNINLSAGPQVLNGADALRYVRYRGGPTADIGRTARQQKFIKAVVAEMMTTKSIFKLPELLPELLANIKTNVPVRELTTLASLGQKFSSGSLITQTLPGFSFTDAKSGASYWQADEKVTGRIIEALYAGETFKVIQDPPKWVSQQPAVKPAEGETPVVATTAATEELQKAGVSNENKSNTVTETDIENDKKDTTEEKDGDKTSTDGKTTDTQQPSEQTTDNKNTATGTTNGSGKEPTKTNTTQNSTTTNTDVTGSAGYTN